MAERIAECWPEPDSRVRKLARTMQGGKESLTPENLHGAQKHIDWCEAAGLTVSAGDPS